ncbi:MBL fold metallo-hydrolase [Ornithinibacillus scapharcae]|uniref:MBL fold metallo-hydrolase n=1 Tax=Ornithinibacillus scapharcae TaxID=1147159 RepID=UPI000225B2AA|nr:MBL fold metallo-hydrolase [Ornithinibacillus scapharcae]
MQIKTKAKLGETSNVRYINGYVNMSTVNLNVYCFEVDGVLIDTGSPRLLKDFTSFFKDADIDKVVITHSHEDHTGGAEFLQRNYQLPIYINEKSINESRERASYPLYRKFFWGKRQPFRAQPIGKTFESRNASWEVIQTPGHAEDHLVFLNKNTGQLFSGDLYIQTRTKLMLKTERVPTIIESIERVLSYDFNEMFCCHAGYVKDGHKALTKKLNYLKELTEEVLSLQKQGYNEKEIHNLLFKRKYPITYLSLGEWDSKHIISSIITRK